MSSDRAGNPRVRFPLEFLAGHHDRQRIICAAIERLAEVPAGVGAGETARLVLDYLTIELPLHIADEEEDLFPLLRERCSEDDEFEALVTMLATEHESDRGLLDTLLPALERIAAGMAPADSMLFSRDALFFATLQRRHLSWENGTMLPLARRRLAPDDLAAMARSMSARRRTMPSDGSDDT